ncbi:MAG: hypothetical protein L3J28_02520 [Candidatus Polarisedimenticolaceae bacterium]|nr:hypothetical protein [Candidatus Polarisedimenticolaceae bacterium]
MSEEPQAILNLLEARKSLVEAKKRFESMGLYIVPLEDGTELQNIDNCTARIAGLDKIIARMRAHFSQEERKSG